mgnify:CR=1 FL=1
MPNGETKPVDEPEIVRIGAVSPFAVILYIVIELFQALATIISLLTASIAMPYGPFRPVDVPEIVLKGGALPFAVLSYTVI